MLISSTFTAAFAQTAAPAKPDANVKADEPASLDRIVVTSNRRNEESQKVSGVVQSVTGEQLRKDGISEFRQIQNVIPGMNIANQEGNVEIFIRGVGSANNTELGDPGAAPHINGIYIPRPRGLGMMFFDVERVEVNKGPQGTLYGRNALAGTINLITAKPRIGQTTGFVQGEVSNRSGGGAEAAFNAPIGETMAIRGAVAYTKKDYGFKNFSAGVPVTAAVAATQPYKDAASRDPAGLEENYGGRLSFLWNVGSSLTITAMADAGHEGGTGYPGANIFSAVTSSKKRPKELDLRNVVYKGPQGEMENDLWGAQAKAEYDAGGYTIEVSGSARSVDFNQRNASSNGIDFPGRDYSSENWDNYSTVFWQQTSKSYIGEVRAYSTDDKARMKWTVGAFGFKEKQQVGFFALADAGYCCYSGTEFTMPDVKGKAAALYTDATFSITDSFRALAGARYTKESKSRYGIGGNWALVLGGEDFGCCIATRLGTPGFVPALLNRPNFDLTNVRTPAQVAQFLIQGTQTPGSRDTLIQQIQAIANGTNPFGNCFLRPDIANGQKCPDKNPSGRNGGFSYANLTIPQQQVGSSKANFGDFRLGFEYDLNKDQMVYGKVATGHKAGGFNDTLSQSLVPVTFEPERITSYELGSRNGFDFMGRRAIFNATTFFYDYKNQVFQDLTCVNIDPTATPPCTGYALVSRNIGRSRLYGLELESRFALGNGFKLDFNALFLKSRITKGTVSDFRAQDFSVGGQTPIINLEGNELPLASRINLTGRIQQVFAVGSGKFDWQALVNYRTAYYLTQFNEDNVVFLDGRVQSALDAGFPDRQKGYATLNLGVGYTIGGLRVEAFAANVTDEQASQKSIAGSGLNIRFLNDARSYGLRARWTF
jgi:iron complex outermembrane receptor protein